MTKDLFCELITISGKIHSLPAEQRRACRKLITEIRRVARGVDEPARTLALAFVAVEVEAQSKRPVSYD